MVEEDSRRNDMITCFLSGAQHHLVHVVDNLWMGVVGRGRKRTRLEAAG